MMLTRRGFRSALMELGATRVHSTAPRCGSVPVERVRVAVARVSGRHRRARRGSEVCGHRPPGPRSGCWMCCAATNSPVDQVPQLDVAWLTDTAQRDRALDSLLVDGLLEQTADRLALRFAGEGGWRIDQRPRPLRGAPRTRYASLRRHGHRLSGLRRRPSRTSSSCPGRSSRSTRSMPEPAHVPLPPTAVVVLPADPVRPPRHEGVLADLGWTRSTPACWAEDVVAVMDAVGCEQRDDLRGRCSPR